MALHSLFPACINGEAPGPDYSSWFGTGEDGDLTVSTDVALPVALDSGQIIKQYNNLTITSTGVLHPANRCNGMILLVKGDLTVDGTIHVDKCAPLLNDNEELAAQEKHVALCGELTGGKGGDGGNAASNASTSSGAGGEGFRFGGGPGGGSGAAASTPISVYAGANGDRPPAGTTIPWIPAYDAASQYGAGGSINNGFLQYRGGGGPGGSGATLARMSSAAYGNDGNDGDAIGGGALWIFVQGKVDIGAQGVIRARGGDGANGVAATTSSGNTTYSGGGGAAGGGIICIVHTGDILNTGSIQAPGGTGGASGGGSATAGANGSTGTVLITNITDLLEARTQSAFAALSILGVQI